MVTMPTELDPQLRGTMLFRELFGTQDDRYEPEIAAQCLEAVEAYDEEFLRLVIYVEAEWAAGQLEGRRN